MAHICIDFGETVVRTAYVSGGKLLEAVYDAPHGGGSLVGNAYVGIIKRVLPNQTAFVDIGCEKGVLAFLQCKPPRTEDPYRLRPGLKCGRHVVVQVLRDASGEKGPMVTTELRVVGRGVVLMENGDDGAEFGTAAGVSHKLEDETLRERLRDWGQKLTPPGCSLILRTDSAEMTLAELETEVDRLYKQLQDARATAAVRKAPAPLYAEMSPLAKTVTELMRGEVSEIRHNHPALGVALQEELRTNGLDVPFCCRQGALPLFQQENLERQWQKAFHPKIWLDCGGYITVEETEACVVIDVNTGKFLGKKDFEASALTVNLEAADEIARQLRLRNLSGIIIVDFINMKNRDNAARLCDALARAVRGDRLSVHVEGMTSLGLMQLTRRRTRESLSRQAARLGASVQG